MVNGTTPDGHVDGFISNGTTSITFETNASCISALPEGSISGTIRDVFTGGPGLDNVTFNSNSPVLLGVEPELNILHVLFNGVSVINTTTNESFSNGTAEVTAERVTSDSWKGSITIHFNSHSLTFFGIFTGNASLNRQALCQVLV